MFEDGIFAGLVMAKILASLALFLSVLNLPVLAIGPIMASEHHVYIKDWHIEKPKAFLSIGKFGLRQGYYILSFNDESHHFEIPIFPDELAWWRNDNRLFSSWKSEDSLNKLISLEGNGPIHLYFSSSKFQGIKIQKIDLLKNLPYGLDVPPKQVGWEHLITQNTKGVSKDELHFDKDSLILLAIIFACLLPTGITLDLARRSVKPYLKN